ncbi:MAG: site-specific DNA-methyltransferase [Candidatus Odinarchaeota archaeon]
MVILEWYGKKKRKDVILVNQDANLFRVTDIYTPIGIDSDKEDNWKNLLICGENESILKLLLKYFAKKISLIYIDPPFATGEDFNLKVQIGENGKIFNNIAYKDKWSEGLDSYLDFLFERLLLMKKFLTNDGSIYVHLDWHISHYIKIMMDEIFGNENFRNEIIWAYPAASVKTRRFFIRSYDTILFYSNSDDYIFNDDPKIYQEFSDRVKNALKEDEKGIYYYRGGSHNGKKLSRKVYIEKTGIFPRDVWTDIPYVRANTLEYQGFSTQKPERLLKRIILASSNENDIIADFFCGSGTTLAVAEKLGRRWIGCDSNKHAIHMTRKRILSLSNSNDILNWKKKYKKDPKSFKILAVGKSNKAFSIPLGFLKKTMNEKKNLSITDAPDLIVQIHQNDNSIEVELIDYIIPFKSLLSKKVKENLHSFSDFIDYWAIDFNYQNNRFTHMWSSYRTPKNRELSLKSNFYQYKKLGTYDIRIKSIDIFGIELEKSYKVNII